MTETGGMAASVASYEQACLDTQVETTQAAGEATLFAFATRSDIIEVALAVIKNTTLAVARYHACGALRVSALETWEALSRSVRYFPELSFRDRLLSMACKLTLEPFERTALLRTVATLSHRAYLEEPKMSRLLFLNDVCRATSQVDETSSSGSVSEALQGLELLAMLVEEFARIEPVSEISNFDRNRRSQAFSEFCGADGELFVIHKAACMALNTLLSMGRKLGSKLDAFAQFAVAVLSAVLSFPTSPREAEDVTASVYVVHRGSEWGPVLNDLPALVPRLFLMYNGCNGGETGNHSSLLESIRDALYSISAVSKASYARDPGTGNQTLLCLLRGLEDRDWAFARSRSELLMYAELWRRISVAYGLESVFLVGGLEALRSFEKNTLSAFRSKISSNSSDLSDSSGDDEWTAESECLLLETWSSFAVQNEMAGGHGGFDLIMAEVAIAFIETSLKTDFSLPGCDVNEDHLSISDEDSAEDFGFGDESHEIALHQAAAQLCRYSGQDVIAFLASIVTDLSTRSFLCSRGNSEVSAGDLVTLRAAQEDFVWIMRLSTAVLADDESAEVPVVPAQYVSSGRKRTSPMPLLTAILQAAELESNTYYERCGQGSDSRPELSPRVEYTVLKSLSRLARTYFVPMDSNADLVRQCLGGEELGGRARSLCLRKGLFTLKYRAFEPDSVFAAAGLLLVLAKARNSTLYPDLRDDALWEPLPSAGFKLFESVPETAVETFGLCLSHLHGEHVADRLAQPVLSGLINAGQDRDKMPNAAQVALLSLQILCGILQCETAKCFVGPILLNAMHRPHGGVFIAAKEFTKSCPSIPLYCAKLAMLLTMHLSSTGETTTQLFEDTVGLIQTSLAECRNDPSNVIEDEDVALTVLVYMDVLQELVEYHGDTSVCNAAYAGLNMIVSVFNEPILMFPTVSPKFFLLVNTLVIKFPHPVVGLSKDLLSTIVSSIMLTMQGLDEIATRRGLDAVVALADFRAQCHNSECHATQSLLIIDIALEAYLKHILECILSGGGHVIDCLDAAADALLHLAIGCDQAFSLFEDACRSFVGGCVDSREDAISVLDRFFGLLAAHYNMERKEANDPSHSLAPPGPVESTSPRQLTRVQFRETIRQLSSVARASFGQRQNNYDEY